MTKENRFVISKAVKCWMDYVLFRIGILSCIFCMCYTHTGTQPMLKIFLSHKLEFFWEFDVMCQRGHIFRVSYESIHANLNYGDRKSSFHG